MKFLALLSEVREVNAKSGDHMFFFYQSLKLYMQVREVRVKMPRMYLRKDILNPCERPPR